MEKKVLVVDDEKPIVTVLKLNLQKEGYVVYEAYDGEEAVNKARLLEPDLILLDVMLPKMDGFTVCKTIREKSSVPILMLTAREEEVDKVLGLELGADDYITKPFRLGELFSRIQALLRRTGIQKREGRAGLSHGDIFIDLEGNRAWLAGRKLELTGVEFRLLCLMVRSAGRVVTRDMILEELWDGRGRFVDDNTLSVYIRRLREKIEEDPSSPGHLVTIRGLGYCWE